MTNRQIFLPQPLLAPFVRYYAGYQVFCPEKVITTMPANPFSGLVFSFKVPMKGTFSYSLAPDEGVRNLDYCTLVGQSNTYSYTEMEGEANVVVAALTGLGLQHLLGESAGNVTNQVFKFNLVSNYFENVQEKLWKVCKITDAIALIEESLLAFYFKHRNIPSFQSNDISVITRHVEKNHGKVVIREVATKYRMTTRWMEKLFLQQVGLSPKSYSRVIRFNHTLKYLYHSSSPSWMDAVEKFGYTDQSHFIKDFQFFLGTSPSQHFQGDLSFNRASRNEV